MPTASEKTQALAALTEVQALLPQIREALVHFQRFEPATDPAWRTARPNWIRQTMAWCDAATPGVDTAKAIVNDVSTTG
jgi:hypothetical protein